MSVDLCRSLRILYLHPSGTFGGASKSLIELFGRLRLVGVEGVILTPQGSACAAFAAAGLEVKDLLSSTTLALVTIEACVGLFYCVKFSSFHFHC